MPEQERRRNARSQRGSAGPRGNRTTGTGPGSSGSGRRSARTGIAADGSEVPMRAGTPRIRLTPSRQPALGDLAPAVRGGRDPRHRRPSSSTTPSPDGPSLAHEAPRCGRSRRVRGGAGADRLAAARGGPGRAAPGSSRSCCCCRSGTRSSACGRARSRYRDDRDRARRGRDCCSRPLPARRSVFTERYRKVAPREQRVADRRSPAYQVLADELREQITSGRLRPGERLPTEPELCSPPGSAAARSARRCDCCPASI